jgi:DNA polymerase-1
MDVNEVITDTIRAVEVLKDLWKESKMTSDIETTGLDWYRSRLLTVSLSPNKDESYCFAIDPQYHNEATSKTMKDLLGRFLSKWEGELIGHNYIGFDIPFLLHMIRGYDFSTPIEPVLNKMKLTDTILMAYLLNNSTERASIGLKELSFKYMGEYDADIDQRNLASAPLEKVATYNNYDCRATWLIYEELQPRIEKEGFAEVFKEFNDIAYDLVKMKMVGLRIDMEKTKKFQVELRELTKKDREALLNNHYVKEAQEVIAREAMKKYNKTHKNKKRDWKEFEEDFNPNSPKQKQVLFFDLMNLPVVNVSKTTKAPSSDAGTIAEWLNDDSIEEDKIEAIKLVSEYMTAQKIQSTYVNVMVEKAVEVAPGDYRLFTNFNQTATITGRLSSSGDVNLQTIPNSSKYGKKVKELFIAPDGFILGTADYSALEDRLIANESKDQNKLNIFLKGIDGHSLNAYGYFKDEFKARGLEYDITDPNSINKIKDDAPDLRQGGKAYTFGFTYGAGPQKYGKDLYDAYWETYQGVKDYNDSVITRAMRDGYLTSKFSGLRLWLPAINSTDEFIQSKEWRVACNFVIQSGNFLMLRAIHKMQRWIEDEGLQDSVKQILTVHDSVYLYVKESPAIISMVNEKLIEFMGIPYEDDQILPLTAELDIGTNMVNFVTLDNKADYDTIQETLEELK